MSATISIIVPVYNARQYLTRCIDSILAQTFRDFELILIDDGSTDRSGEICDEYAEKDGRIRVIHQDNKGPSAARNAGLDHVFKSSESRYLTFVDSDDYVYPEYLRLLYLPIENNLAEISSCRLKPTSDPIVEIEEEKLNSTLPKVYTVEDYYCERTMDCIHSVGKLYPKSDFSSIRFPDNRKYAEDASTIYRVIFSHDRIAFVFLPLYGYFQSSNSLVRSAWNPQRLNSIKAFEEQTSFFEENGYLRAAKVSAVTHIFYVLDNLSHLCGDNVPADICDTRSLKKDLSRQFRSSLKRYAKFFTLKEKAKNTVKFVAIKTGILPRKRKK